MNDRFSGLLAPGYDVTRRGSRWLALGIDEVAFAVDDEAGWVRLEREAWLYERWRAGGVPVPRVVRVDATRRVQVRERLHGLHGEEIHTESGRSPLFDGVRPSVAQLLDGAPVSAFGERLATSYGEVAARIRRAVSVDDARAVGFAATSRATLDLDAALAKLRASQAAAAAKTNADRARRWLAELPPVNAVIHGDLHFFNMCAHPDGQIAGVFDVDDAGLDAAETELLYAHSMGSRFVELVVAAYGPVDLAAVWRAHLRTALDHVLLYGPDHPRHPRIIEWASAVFERA